MQFQIIGCGKMGEVILKGLVDFGIKPEDISVQENNEGQCTLLKDAYKTNFGINPQADIIILAVKPQQIASVDFSMFPRSALIFSIMAGITIQRLEEITGLKSIIRSMPNLPISVGRGVIGYVQSGDIDVAKKEAVLDIFARIGKIIKLQNEDQIDQITALSGSGPAYFFYLTELAKHQAREFGFSEEEATLIAQETFIGSALLLDQSGQSASQLKANITSKGGTTKAALQTMQDEGMGNAVLDGIKSAYQRAKELNV